MPGARSALPVALRILRRHRFLLVLALAFLVRFVDIGGAPLELHADELAGLVGIENIRSGRAPLVPFFDLRVEYLPLYGVLESVSTWILGTSALGIRLPAVLLGVASVAALRWLVYELTDASSLADGCAAIFAVLPWAIDVSRLGWENAAVFPFLLGGLAALTRGLRRGESAAIVAAGILFGIGAYSYRAELFDAILLAAALLALQSRSARRQWRALAVAAVVAAALIAPLAIAVVQRPRFFWRDANIATFGHGYTLGALANFESNYIAHFEPGPLFATGDGFLDHGPAYGVLYWWMLPFIVIGTLTAWQMLGARVATFLYVWIALYPLGGALTNDGVPDFPRTMIGAPLACILAATGVRYAWLALMKNEFGRLRLGTAAVALFACITVLSTLDFMRTYLFVYPAASADAFKAGTAAMFRTIRRLEVGRARVCFGSLDWYNYETLTGFYLAGSPLIPIEGVTPECRLAHSLIVVGDPSKTVPGSHLAATQHDHDGTPMAYIYTT